MPYRKFPNEDKGLRDALLQGEFEKTGTADAGSSKGLGDSFGSGSGTGLRDALLQGDFERTEATESGNNGFRDALVQGDFEKTGTMVDEGASYDGGDSGDTEDSTSTWLILGAVVLAIGGTWWMMSNKK